MSTAAPDFLGLSTIGQIGISVADVNRAIAFYRDVLRMKLLFQVPNMGFFDCNGVRLMLSGSENPTETHSSVVYFKVAEIQQAYQALLQAGAEFERPPHLVARLSSHELWMAFFRDPDRNLLALMSEVQP